MWETVEQWKELEKRSGLNEKFPDVTFKWTALESGQLHQKALTSLGAGLAAGLPSIIRISMNYYRALVHTDGLTDFTDAVEPSKSDVLANVYDGLVVEDKLFAAPDDTGVMMFGYRRDLFEKAGLPTEPDEVEAELRTYDDLLSAGRKLAKVDAKLFNETGSTFSTLILQDTTGYFDADGNVIFDSPAHVECAELAKKIWDSGLTTHYESNSPQMWTAYKQGKLATMFYPNWQDFIILGNAPATKDKWNAVKMPAVKAGGRRASSADGCAMIVPNVLDQQDKDLAVEVVKFLKLTQKAQVAHMNVFSGAFCSYRPALEAMSDVTSPVLHDQQTYQLFLDSSEDEEILPWYRTSSFFNDADKAVQDAMFRICKQDAPIEATLKAAADSIRSRQDQKGQK